MTRYRVVSFRKAAVQPEDGELLDHYVVDYVDPEAERKPASQPMTREEAESLAALKNRECEG